MNRHLVFALCACILSGCSSIPKDAFVLKPSSLEDRRLESRIFTTQDQTALLKEGATILENMGYQTDLMNTDVGLLTATKHKSKSGAGTMIMSILSAGLASTGEEQTKAILTAMPPSDGSKDLIARLTLQHIVFESNGEAASVELIKDKDIYQLFYERLGAAMFIEPDKI
jgi:hypothetical protein